MMLKLWQKKLKLSYKKEVIDIVQFGSSVLEESEPKDIDIAVIFKKIPLKEQLEERQNINITLMRVNQKLEDINMRLYKMELK